MTRRMTPLVLGLVAAMLSSIQGCSPEKNEIEISAVLPLSGNAAVVGEYSRKGLELAITEANAAGGLLGKKLRLDVQDSKGDPKEAVTIVQRALAKGKPLLIYSQLSGPSMAMKPIVEKAEVMMFGVAGADGLLADSKFSFRNYVGPSRIGEEAAQLIKDSLRTKVLGVFFSNNDFGRSIKDAIVSKASQIGVEIGFASEFEEKDLDYRTTILKDIKKKVETIYVVGIGRSLGVFFKQLGESGYNGNIVGGLETPFPDVLNIAGSTADGIYYVDFAYDVKIPTDSTKEFIARYSSRFGEAPQTPSVVAYDALRLLCAKVRAVGSLDPKTLTSSLNATSGFEGVFGPIAIKTFDIIYPLKLKRIIK